MPDAPHPLVIRLGSLGDAVLLQPLLHKLQQRYGAPCDLLAVGAWAAELYAGQPEVAEVFARLKGVKVERSDDGSESEDDEDDDSDE